MWLGDPRPRRRWFLLSCAAAVLWAGCGGDGRPRQTHSVLFDVGGSVAYAGDISQPLAGASVTLIDVGGTEFTATTGSHGLWAIDNLAPGVFFEHYELGGYEDISRQFTLDAFGENDVANAFVSLPPVAMSESPLRLNVQPFDVLVSDGDVLVDGVAGQVLVYDASTDGPLVLTATLPVYSYSDVYLQDSQTGDFVVASLDSATRTVFTIAGADIDAMNGGLGLTTDQDPFTIHAIVLEGLASFLPIHGEPTDVNAFVRFNAVP